MDFLFLDKFISRLGYDMTLFDSNLSYELFKLDSDVAHIKHEVLLKLITIDVNNRNDYLDYIITELRTSYEHAPDVSSVEKWLKKYNITIEDVLKRSNIDLRFRKIISSKFEFNPASAEEEEVYYIQKAFFFYFSNFFAYDLIEFLESKKVKSENFHELPDTNDAGKIKWVGKPSQLGFIIRQLVDLGYIEAPIRKDGEINYTQFAKNIRITFNIKTTDDTLIKYLNFDSEKSQSIIRKFKESGFNIPHKNRIS